MTGDPPSQPRTPVRKRLVGYFLLVLVIPSITIPFLSLGYLYREIRGAHLEQQRVKAIRHAQYLESRLNASATRTLVVSQVPEVRSLLNAASADGHERALKALRYRLRAFLARQAGLFESVLIADARGIPQLELFLNARGEVVDVPPADRDVSDADFFTGALHLAAIQGQPLPVYYSHPSPDAPLDFSTLLKNDAGIISGVLLLRKDLDAFFERSATARPGELCQIMDGDGRIVQSGPAPLPDWMMEEQWDTLLHTRSGVFPAPGLFAEHAYVHARIQPEGQSAVRWSAVYAIPMTQFGESFRNAILLILLVTAAAVVLSTGLALSLATQISRPILQLATAARDIAAGYWDSVLPDTRHDDEIRTLTRAFGSMSRQLRSAQETLLKKVEDLRISERRLSEEKERLGITLRSIRDGVVATDLEGHILLINPVAADMLGVTADQATGEAFEHLAVLRDAMSGEDLHGWVDRIRASEPQTSPDAELLLTNRGGQTLRVEQRSSLIRNPESEPVGVVIVFRDVTATRELARERRRVERLDSLGVLAGGIAHDFNNLLAVVLGDVSLLMEKLPEGSPERDLAAEISDAVVRTRDLTRQLLTFSKGGVPVKTRTSLPELVRESAEFALHGSSCQLDLETGESLRDASLDPSQIHNVFHNLVLNAVQAMPDGGTVRARLRNLDVTRDTPLPLRPGPYVLVELSDDGPGIRDGDLDRIFDPYYTTKETGSGLGLSRVFSIMKSHDGHIQAVSHSGGALFRLYFPAETAPSVPVPGIQNRSAPVTGTARVLVMDDEPGVRLTTSKLLQSLGYEAEACENGEQAIEAFDAAREAGRPFDAVVLDLTIRGGMGGRDTLHELRKRDPNLRAIVSSGYSRDVVLTQFREHGFRGMLQKPFSRKELAEAIRSVLDGEEPTDTDTRQG